MVISYKRIEKLECLFLRISEVIYLMGVNAIYKKYFIYAKAVSIMVGGNWAVPRGNT